MKNIYNFFVTVFSYGKLTTLERENISFTFVRILYIYTKVMQNKSTREGILKDVKECDLEDKVTLILTSLPYGDR